jgi:hypothetical protein
MGQSPVGTVNHTGVTRMPTTDEAIGIIKPDELYTLKAFARRLGIGAATLRSARRAGLKVYYVHKHAYVFGRDWIDYVIGTPERQVAETTDRKG